MRNVGMAIGCMAVLGMAGTSWGAVGDILVSEDFEGFASTAAMTGVWAGASGTLDTAQGSDGIGGSAGQSAFHPGGAVNELLIPGGAVLPTATEWLKLSVDVFDFLNPNPSFDPLLPPDPVTNPEFLNADNKRFTMGMRWFNGNPFSPLAENIVELGHWNAIDPEDDPLTTFTPHFAYRAVIFAGPGAEPSSTGWDGWDMGTVLTDPLDPLSVIEKNSFQGGGGEAWHRYSVSIGPDTVIFDIDLDMDGTVDFSNTFTGLVTTANGFDRLRFGGPSGVSSGGGGGNFDNILLERIAPVAAAIAGDLNGDGFVGVDDLNIVLVNWNATVTAGDLLSGDPTGDAFVGVDDLNIVLVNWNNGTPPPPGAASPEPASLALLGMGGLAMLRRRQR